MKTTLYNQNKEEIGEVNLPKEIFEVEVNPDLIHQVVLSQQSNRRQGSAHAKMRGEVSGGGKKPWRQKGTGRARHGSTRSPLWKGGGVTFGPRNDKNYKKTIPVKMKRKALFMVLSAKATENMIVVVDKFNITEPKTKEMATSLKKLTDKSALLVLSKMDKNLILSTRNIPKIESIQATDLNVLDLLTYKYVVISKAGIKKIKDTFIDTKH
ncbi:50S ribosomal protein L4 [Patescibacteria group bacterium]|nr:50S ribosomal protein L4 [Patescibacteria group bacterium]